MNFWRFEISLAMCKQRRLNAGPLFCGANSSVGKEFATGRSNGSQKGNPRSSFFQQMLNSIRSSESSVPQDLLEVVESSNSEKQRWDPMGWMTLRGFAMDFWLDFKGNFELNTEISSLFNGFAMKLYTFPCCRQGLGYSCISFVSCWMLGFPNLGE